MGYNAGSSNYWSGGCLLSISRTEYGSEHSKHATKLQLQPVITRSFRHMRFLLSQYIYIYLVYINAIEPQRKRGLIVSSLLYGLLAMLFLFPFCY